VQVAASTPKPRRGSRCVQVLDGQPKRVVRRYYNEVVTERRLEVLRELLSSGFVGHDPTGATMDRVEYHDAVRMLHDGFATLVVSIDDQVAEKDRVATRWTATGTHTGWFAGIAPTGREVTLTGIDIHRLDGDRIVELWEQLDLATLLAQLL
jgi:predicted ester cyclase